MFQSGSKSDQFFSSNLSVFLKENFQNGQDSISDGGVDRSDLVSEGSCIQQHSGFAISFNSITSFARIIAPSKDGRTLVALACTLQMLCYWRTGSLHCSSWVSA
jgi:hypothetical protein